MELSIQYINFNAYESLESFLNKKIKKIERFSKDINDIAIYLKVENTNDKENKLVEIKLNLPNNSLIVKKRDHTFESAIMNAIDVLVRQLKQLKYKHRH